MQPELTATQRPDIRSPRFNVSVYKPELVSPGYWFTAPYVDLKDRLPTALYSPGQTGPHIYDGRGDLVWCGSHLFDDRPTFDFRVARHNGSEYLTFLAGEDLHEFISPGGSGHFLDTSYNYHGHPVYQPNGRGIMNMHEFRTIGDGKRALTVTHESKFFNVNDGSPMYDMQMFVGNNGFSELDLATGETVFSWWALDHVHIFETESGQPVNAGTPESPWDFFHLNSVDKNAEGDYLISARHTSTIYKISGKDGSILWRLGGTISDFTLEGFNMSSQHDARWDTSDDTATRLTFLNNHSGRRVTTATTSSAVEVVLNMTTMTARLARQWDRPDGQLTDLRGNAQRLDNGHMFVGWSENSYITEFTDDGDVVMEAQMASHRFSTYRTYKFNFTATPSEPIAVRAFVYGVRPETSTTVVYVSWNGATEVVQWRFWASASDGLETVGVTARTGFETMFMANGAFHEIKAEALDINGNSLGFSDVARAELPASWELHDNEFQELGGQGGNAPHRFHSGIAGLEETQTSTPDVETIESGDEREIPTSTGFESTLPKLIQQGHSVTVVCAFALMGFLSLAVIASLRRRLKRRRYHSSSRGKYELLRDEV